jgi:hypothetical protein
MGVLERLHRRQNNSSPPTGTIGRTPTWRPDFQGFRRSGASRDRTGDLLLAKSPLIGAAALLPVALLGALAWWIGAAIRRRRREQALDMV